jgi:hypothetical protein
MTTMKERIEQLPELPVETFEIDGKLDYVFAEYTVDSILAS